MIRKTRSSYDTSTRLPGDHYRIFAQFPHSHLLPLHDDRLRQRVVAALLIGEALQIVQLGLELVNEILLFFPLSLQALPLLPLTLTGETHTMTLILTDGECQVTTVTDTKSVVLDIDRCGIYFATDIYNYKGGDCL